MRISYLTLALVLLSLLLGYQLVATHQQLQARVADAALLAAIQDSVHYYRDQTGRVVAEKRAIEADFAQVKAHAAALSGNQRALLHDIASLPRTERKHTTSATSIQQVATMRVRDSLAVASPQGRTWSHESDTLRYRISTRDSLLTIEELTIPNRLSVITYRDKQQELHVQVTNTNPIYRTQDIDAIIPRKPKKKQILVKILALLGAAALGFTAR